MIGNYLSPEEVELYADLFYICSVLLMIYPAIVNKHHYKNRFLIGLFVLQGAVQPFLSNIDPYLCYAAIFVLNLPFAIYAWSSGINKTWLYIAGITFVILLINMFMAPIYHYMHTEQLDPVQYLIYDDLSLIAILSLRTVQAYLIIKATDGFRGDIQYYLHDIRVRFNGDFNRYKLGLRNSRINEEN